MLLLPTLVFLTVVCTFVGLYLWLAPTRTQERLQTVMGTQADASWRIQLVRLSGPLAELSLPKGRWEQSPLKIRFLNAGIRQESARLIYFAAKTILPFIAGSLAFIALQTMTDAEGLPLLLQVTLVAVIACYAPDIYLRWKVNARKREIFESFPDAADLMLVCVEAGLGLDAGLSKVAEEIRINCRALADELHLTNLEIRAGAARDQSLRNLALRTGVEEVGVFASMLTQADKFGTSIGESLRVFSDDLRHKRQVRAEEAAAKVPTKMLVPLVLFIFPSIIMVIMGPAIIQIVRTLLPSIVGTNV
jgi:tight adherence protein C